MGIASQGSFTLVKKRSCNESRALLLERGLLCPGQGISMEQISGWRQHLMSMLDFRCHLKPTLAAGAE